MALASRWDLRPLATAPALDQLEINHMRHLEPKDLRPFVGHPRLRAASVSLGSDRKNDALDAMLGLRPVLGDLDWRAD